MGWQPLQQPALWNHLQQQQQQSTTLPERQQHRQAGNIWPPAQLLEQQQQAPPMPQQQHASPERRHQQRQSEGGHPAITSPPVPPVPMHLQWPPQRPLPTVTEDSQEGGATAAVTAAPSSTTFSLTSVERQADVEAGHAPAHPLAWQRQMELNQVAWQAEQGRRPEAEQQQQGQGSVHVPNSSRQPAASEMLAFGDGKGDASGRIDIEARAGTGRGGGSGETPSAPPANEMRPGAWERPSRTAALRKRHVRQLRKTDRDTSGVPVPSTARPFGLWASPLQISEACTGEAAEPALISYCSFCHNFLSSFPGLGVYLASLRSLALLALLLCITAIYPLVNNLQVRGQVCSLRDTGRRVAAIG